MQTRKSASRNGARRTEIGGKATALELAAAAGLPVPPFFVVKPAEISSLSNNRQAREALLRSAGELGATMLAIRSSAVPS